MDKLKMLDTFAGIGGFSYAAKYLIDLGIETTGFVEIDPFCQKILSKNFPNIPIYDDIRTFTARPFQYDLISSGFPCQDISVAGRQKGITKTTRSGLFYELIKVIRMVRPKYVILENVSAILNNGMGIVLAELYEAGYDAEWATFPASLIGAAHQRDRWWLVGKIADTDNYGRERREYETRNKIITRQNSQSEWSANTNHTKRQSDDGDDIGQSRVNENLSRSSDGGKTFITETRGICELSERTDNNQGINRENNNQEDNYRALVSQGQSRVQLSIDRELGGNQTTSKNNSIRQGDDNSSEQRMDGKGQDVANTKSGTWDEHEVKREHGEVETQKISRDRDSGGDTRESSDSISEGMEERISQFDKELQKTRSVRSSDSSSDRRSTSNSNSLQRFELLRQQPKQGQETQQGVSNRNNRQSTSNPNSIRTQSKNEGYNPSWKVPVGNGETRQTLSPKWRGYVSQPCLRRGDDGLRGRMDRLKALGNSVVPQCAAIPLQRVIQLEREQQ